LIFFLKKNTPMKFLNCQEFDAKFPITDLLGSGGYGKVFKSNNVAIKISNEFESMIREINIYNILDHECIIPVHGWTTDKESMKIAMSKGVNLLKSFKNGNITFEQIVYDTLSACAYFEAQSYFHGDITLENVVFHKGRAKFIDFGLTRKVHHGSKQADKNNLLMLFKFLLQNSDYKNNDLLAQKINVLKEENVRFSNVLQACFEVYDVYEWKQDLRVLGDFVQLSRETRDTCIALIKKLNPMCDVLFLFLYLVQKFQKNCSVLFDLAVNALMGTDAPSHDVEYHQNVLSIACTLQCNIITTTFWDVARNELDLLNGLQILLHGYNHAKLQKQTHLKFCKFISSCEFLSIYEWNYTKSP